MRLFADLKRSFLGWSWLLILPFFSIITWIFMKGAGVLNPGDVGIPYLAFVLLSTTLWSGFFDTYKGCSQIFQNYGKIMLVNTLPVHVVVFSEIFVAVVRFSIPFSFILIYFLVQSIPMSMLGFLFPLIYLPMILFGATIGLLSGLFNAIAKDFTFLMDKVIHLLMLLSPVVYSVDVSTGFLAKILRFNPITYFISSARNILIEGDIYMAQNYYGCSLLILIIFILLTRFFILNTSRILERGDF